MPKNGNGNGNGDGKPLPIFILKRIAEAHSVNSFELWACEGKEAEAVCWEARKTHTPCSKCTLVTDPATFARLQQERRRQGV